MPVWLRCRFHNPRNHKGNPMKYSTEELLLASAVIDRALPLYEASIPLGLTPEQKKEWRATHPLNEFIIPGLVQLEKTAEIIRQRSAQ